MPVSDTFVKIRMRGIEQRLKNASPERSADHREAEAVMKIKTSLHRKSGIVNKVKPEQRSRKKLALGNPCEQLSLINCQQT